MKNLTKLFLFLVATSLFIQSCQNQQEEQIKTDGREVISFKVIPFELDQVKLLEGTFRHANNTQIPKLTGLARIYEFTGDTAKKNTAEFFWKTVVNHHSYVTGGNGNKEYFGPADSLRDELGQNTTESCNVYNMLKLTRHFFQYDASARKADFYERALFNHILSSQHHQDGRVIYNLSLAMGGYKEYQDPHWFTCCVGTGMENHSKSIHKPKKSLL